jgi:hypothetical protein
LLWLPLLRCGQEWQFKGATIEAFKQGVHGILEPGGVGGCGRHVEIRTYDDEIDVEVIEPSGAGSLRIDDVAFGPRSPDPNATATK